MHHHGHLYCGSSPASRRCLASLDLDADDAAAEWAATAAAVHVDTQSIGHPFLALRGTLWWICRPLAENRLRAAGFLARAPGWTTHGEARPMRYLRMHAREIISGH